MSLIDLGEHRLKDLNRPEHLYQLKIDGLDSEFPALKSLDQVANNLPTQLTSFVGRTSELRSVAQVLTERPVARLVTMTGPPGTGKSQLVVDLLASCAHAGKPVLFASKNNKAIDVVRARLRALLGEDCDWTLRLGSRNERHHL